MAVQATWDGVPVTWGEDPELWGWQPTSPLVVSVPPGGWRSWCRVDVEFAAVGCGGAGDGGAGRHSDGVGVVADGSCRWWGVGVDAWA